jgi:4-amino-4-deoxy-L-arabinose transferase-like glycosyltransferase
VTYVSPVKTWHEGAILVVACALLYLTGSGEVPFYTRGEPREGLVVREMLRTGDWLVPARPGGALAKKPPLYYWTAAATTTLLPHPPERAMRLPSALFGTAGVLVTWAAARHALPAGAALPAALILATSFEWTRAATSARVDMALAAPLALLLAAWSAALAPHVGHGRLLVVVAAVAAALGVLGKGPIALVLPALAIGALLVLPRHRPAALRLWPATTLVVAAALAALWYAAAFARQGWAFVEVVARENLLRFLDTDAADTGHAHGPLYLLGLGLVGVLPWTPIAPLAWAAPRTPVTALAAGWVVAGAAFLALATSKRSVYLLPLYPALALLVAGGMGAAAGRALVLARLGARTYPIALALIAAVAAAGALGVDVTAPIRPLLKPQDAAGALALVGAARDAGPALLLLAFGTAGAAFAAGHALRSDAWPRLVLVVAAAFVAWTAFFNGVLHPAIGRGLSVREFLAHVGTVVPPGTPLHARFPPDPAVRFYAPRELLAWPDDRATGAYVLLWEDEWRGIRDERGRALEVIAVSDSTRSRSGHLALVRAPHGRVRAAAAPPPASESAPGLRNSPD